MPTQKILVSWLGTYDVNELIKSEKGEEPKCALTSLLASSQFGPFDELCLFVTRDLPIKEEDKIKSASALNALQQICEIRGVKLRICHAADNSRAASPERLQDFTITQLEKLYSNRLNYFFYYNVTSGTALMSNIQFYLSQNSRFRGKALYTIPPSWINSPKPFPDNVYAVQLSESLADLDDNFSMDDKIYQGPNRKIYDQIKMKVAASDASVLILGDTGVGKSVLAEYIWRYDEKRRNKNFECVNCGAFSDNVDLLKSELFGHVKGAYTGAEENHDGAFQKADGGVLFLDEIGEMPLTQQAALLRALDTGKIKPMGSNKEIAVNVRIIAATNVNPERAIKSGRFREDLYYRLAQYTPRLKSVKEYTLKEKETLVLKLLNDINRESGRMEPRSLSPEALSLLLRYEWPGNIREMKFRLGSVCLLSDAVITADDIREQIAVKDAATDEEERLAPSSTRAAAIPPAGHCEESDLPQNLPDWLKSWENYWLKEANYHHSSQKDAAKRLGLKTSTFNTKFGKAR